MELCENVAPGIIISGQDNKPKHKCDWKDCSETHEKKISYPEGGTVSRNSSYEKDWVSAKLEPWEKYGPGLNSKATLSDYSAETPKAKYRFNAAAMNHPAYHTQKHHLISVNLFGNVTKLSHDAKLIGYDVNHKNNGICLPTYVIDIIQHDLQCHRGSHPNNLYNSKITPLLRNLEKICIRYCKVDSSCDAEPQKNLTDDLNALSRRIEMQIKTWKWLLRKDAINERQKSNDLYKQNSSNN